MNHVEYFTIHIRSGSKEEFEMRIADSIKRGFELVQKVDKIQNDVFYKHKGFVHESIRHVYFAELRIKNRRN